MKGKVLIAGGTGMVGSKLTEMLQKNGFEVSYLSRSHGNNGTIKNYVWDINKKQIDTESIKTADYIINLAGASLIDKKWTKEFKKEIITSRTGSVDLLYESLKSTPNNVKAFISASAIGYYGADTGDKLMIEESSPGNDFLAEVVVKWENSVEKIESLSIRTCIMRIGIAMSDTGGALDKLITPIKMNAGAAIGSGDQFISWIHIDDVCGIILKSLEDTKMKGIYNLVAPHPATNEELTKTIASVLNKSILLPNIPSFALKLILGSEKAEIILGGNKVSANKIERAGYQFKFPELKNALHNLLKS